MFSSRMVRCFRIHFKINTYLLHNINSARSNFVMISGCTVQKELGRGKKSKHTQKKSAGHPHFWTCPIVSRGHVLFVPRTFCPLYVELHIHQVGTSRMSPAGLTPRPSRLFICSLFTPFFFCPLKNTKSEAEEVRSLQMFHVFQLRSGPKKAVVGPDALPLFLLALDGKGFSCYEVLDHHVS